MDVLDGFFSQYDGLTLQRLQQVRAALRQALPEAVECISYNLPTFDINGHHVIHFGGFKYHIGLYPTPSGIEGFEAELAAYPQGKGSVQFPHDRDLPLDLIQRIALHRRDEVLQKKPKKKAQSST